MISVTCSRCVDVRCTLLSSRPTKLPAGTRNIRILYARVLIANPISTLAIAVIAIDQTLDLSGKVVAHHGYICRGYVERRFRIGEFVGVRGYRHGYR